MPRCPREWPLQTLASAGCIIPPGHCLISLSPLPRGGCLPRDPPPFSLPIRRPVLPVPACTAEGRLDLLRCPGTRRSGPLTWPPAGGTSPLTGGPGSELTAVVHGIVRLLVSPTPSFRVRELPFRQASQWMASAPEVSAAGEARTSCPCSASPGSLCP